MRFGEIRNLPEETVGSALAKNVPVWADNLRKLLRPSQDTTGQGGRINPNPQQSKGPNPVSPSAIDSYLKSKGVSKIHRMGILANINRESGFDSGVLGDNGTSGGLFQHHNERFTAMRRAAGNNWQTNWQGQVDYALSEPEGQQYLQIRFRNAQQATAWFTRYFERPANVDREIALRIAGLRKIAADTSVA